MVPFDDLQFRELNTEDVDEVDQTAFLLNSEWPKYNRVDWLKSSSRKFPLSFVLIDRCSDYIIGHARLNVVAEHNDAMYMESVIIGSKFRGKGLGRVIVNMMEMFCRRRNFNRLYLATTDKRSFYEHLGYKVCEPIQVVHSSQDSEISNRMRQLLQRSASREQQNEKPELEVETELEIQNESSPESDFNSTQNLPKTDTYLLESQTNQYPSPPPPPPVPAAPPSYSNLYGEKLANDPRIFMIKFLSPD